MTGRYCNICGRMGGSGFAFALKTLLQAGAGKDWSNPTWQDGKAHAPCVSEEQRKLKESQQ